MSNSNSTFHSITSKLQEFFIQNPDIIVLTIFNSSILHFNSLPPVDPTTNTTITLAKLKIHKKRMKKSNFAKMTSNKVFPGKSWEQIKNKLGHLMTKYNDINEKENKTGRGAQAKWKWFERIDTLFRIRENYNPGFLVDGFSNNVELFNSFEEK
ncbi:17741_t:CDS:2 [Funneliformis geosporum]|nr:17741_t:CDS:2 [Funneliformis geosporum]